MSKRAVVLACGLAAMATLVGAGPFAYRWIRIEALLGKLESEVAPQDAFELVGLGALAEARRRLEETSSRQLAANLVDLAKAGLLDAGTRRTVFEIAFPVLPRNANVPLSPRKPGPDELLIRVRIQGSTWELAGAGGDWVEAAVPLSSGYALHAQYFLAGAESDARLVYQRAVFAPGGQAELEIQDLTAVPDPLNLFLRPPARIALEDGELAVELRLASMGTWRQFVRGRLRHDGSVAYEVHLDRSAAGKEPLLLGRIAVSIARVPQGEWHGEDAVRGVPLRNLARGAHWIDWAVPSSEHHLAPLQKLTLLFRPAPAYARSLGFEVSATECLPFERQYWLPPFTE